MKTNNKIIGLKRFAKSICHCERSVAILIILALMISLGIMAVPMAGIVEASPGEWYVDGTLGTDGITLGTGIEIEAFKTIQYAINDSRVLAGNTIYVAAGTYNECVDINKSLTLQGENRDTTVIDVGGGYEGIKITASDVTVDGFTMQNSKYFLLQTDTSSTQDNIALKNNIFSKGRVQLYSINNLEFSHNQISGFSVWSCSGMLSDNTMSNVLMGISVMFCDGLAIQDNTIVARVGENTDGGIFVDGGSNIEVEWNTIIGLTAGEREYYTWGTAGAGINIMGGATNITVEQNTLLNNTLGVLVEGVVEGSGIHINHNNLEGNTEFGVLNCGVWTGRDKTYTLASAIIDATKNWWDYISGPTHLSNPDGKGDAVSDNVDFIPFLESSGGVVVNNVSITKSGPTSANSGDDITYTITYKNIGTNDATDVVITETYPSEVEYVSANPGPDEGNNIWKIGDLALGEGSIITITVHIK